VPWRTGSRQAAPADSARAQRAWCWLAVLREGSWPQGDRRLELQVSSGPGQNPQDVAGGGSRSQQRSWVRQHLLRCRLACAYAPKRLLLAVQQPGAALLLSSACRAAALDRAEPSRAADPRPLGSPPSPLLRPCAQVQGSTSG